MYHPVRIIEAAMKCLLRYISKYNKKLRLENLELS